MVILRSAGARRVLFVTFAILSCMYDSRNSRRQHYDVHSSPTTRRPRTAPNRQLTRSRVQRRDEFQPKVISSHRAEAWNTIFGKNAGLQPVRDTGIALQSRREIHAARRRQQLNLIIIVAIIVFFVLLFAGVFWMQKSDARGRRLAEKKSTADARSITQANAKQVYASATKSETVHLIASPSLNADMDRKLSQEAYQAGVTGTHYTPRVAQYKNLAIHLPVSVKTLTEVAFHQASFRYTLPLSTHMPFLDLTKAAKQKGTKRDKSKQPQGMNVPLEGMALKFWRSGRHTAAMTAIDCGSKAGSLVYAPISGVVTKVCTYNYDNKCTDYEIHIQPTQYPNLEIVMIHVTDPYIVVGDQVTGGLTPVARVRDIGKYVRNQLATYTKGTGNHVHIQLNDTTTAEYKKRQATLVTVDESEKTMQSVGMTPEAIARAKTTMRAYKAQNAVKTQSKTATATKGATNNSLK